MFLLIGKLGTTSIPTFIGLATRYVDFCTLMQDSCNADQFQPKEEVISVLKDAEIHEFASAPPEKVVETTKTRTKKEFGLIIVSDFTQGIRTPRSTTTGNRRSRKDDADLEVAEKKKRRTRKKVVAPPPPVEEDPIEEDPIEEEEEFPQPIVEEDPIQDDEPAPIEAEIEVEVDNSFLLHV